MLRYASSQPNVASLADPTFANSFTQTPSVPVAPAAGPHPWQIAPWAKLVRRLMRRRAYTRYVDRYCETLTVRGAARLSALDGPAIFIANHQSHMDTLVLFEAMPEAIRRNLYFGAAADRWYVRGKKKLVLQPWYQSMVLGNFPIVRGGGSKALDYAGWLLRQGCHVCIFPEGTRATKDDLGRFKPGVAMLALEHDVPVVPVYLSGLREMRPKGALHAQRGDAGVDVCEPVRFARGTPVDDATRTLHSILDARHRAAAGCCAARL